MRLAVHGIGYVLSWHSWQTVAMNNIQRANESSAKKEQLQAQVDQLKGAASKEKAIIFRVQVLRRLRSHVCQDLESKLSQLRELNHTLSVHVSELRGEKKVTRF